MIINDSTRGQGCQGKMAAKQGGAPQRETPRPAAAEPLHHWPCVRRPAVPEVARAHRCALGPHSAGEGPRPGRLRYPSRGISPFRGGKTGSPEREAGIRRLTEAGGLRGHPPMFADLRSSSHVSSHPSSLVPAPGGSQGGRSRVLIRRNTAQLPLVAA